MYNYEIVKKGDEVVTMPGFRGPEDPGGEAALVVEYVEEGMYDVIALVGSIAYSVVIEGSEKYHTTLYHSGGRWAVQIPDSDQLWE